MAETELQFDRASYATGGGSPCTSCKRPLGDEYWQWQKHMLCRSCRDVLTAKLDEANSGSSFGKALLLGGGTALGLGIAYAIFVGVTKMQLALVTIGIAYLIARVVRKASGGLSGRRFQVLAVVLTYVASAMGYTGPVLQSFSHADSKDTAAHVAPAPGPTAGGSDTGAPPASVETKSPPSLVGVVVAFAVLFAVTLAAPLLSITDAPIGTLIVLFGLWEAWKLSRGVTIQILGPFRLGAPAPPVPGA